MEKWEKVARQLLNLKPNDSVPHGLAGRLTRVANLVGFGGGVLGSRQAIAVVIEQWERDEEARIDALEQGEWKDVLS